MSILPRKEHLYPRCCGHIALCLLFLLTLPPTEAANYFKIENHPALDFDSFLASSNNTEDETRNKYYSGSSRFKKCVALADTSWNNIDPENEGWSKAWVQLNEGALENTLSEYAAKARIDPQPKEIVQGNILKLLKKKFKAVKAQGQKLYECQAVWAITAKNAGSLVDWSKSEHTTKGTAQSHDGRIQCATVGPETQDFPACSTMATKAAIFKVTDAVVGIAQGVDIQEASFAKQQRLNQEKNYFKGGLEYQRTMLKKRAEQEFQKTAINTGKFAVFLHAYKKMPTREGLLKRCLAHYPQNNQKIAQTLSAYRHSLLKFGAAIKISGPSSDDPSATTFLFNRAELDGKLGANDLLADASSICEETAYNESFMFVMNDGAKEVAKQLMVEAGVDASKSLLSYNMLNSQADQVSKALSEVEDFKPADLTPLPQTDLSIEQCTADPNAPGCEAILGTGQEFGFQGDSVNLGGTGQNTVAGEIAGADQATQKAAREQTPVATSDSSGGQADVVDNINKSNQFISDPSKASAGKNPAGPGANAAGGSAGSGKSMASGAKGGNGGAEERAARAPSSIKARYSGNGTSPRFAGGKGQKKRSRSKSNSNPFNGLFGKKKPAKKNNILNFRGIASHKKGTSIFNQISKRYDLIEEDRRVMHYDP